MIRAFAFSWNPAMQHEDKPEATGVLALVPNEWQATLIATALRDRGINAQVTGATTAGFRAEAPGLVRVIVPKSQLEDARVALAEHRDQVSDIDWSQVDVGDPE